MKEKMTSKRALQKLSYVPIFEDDDSNMITDTCCCVYVGDLCEVYDSEVNVIKKDLNRLEKLEQENQELKEKVNHFEKIIEVMQNPSKLDCTHMFDNCKELKPLTEKKEHKMDSLEALKLAILEYVKDLETDKNNQWVKNVLKGLKKCQQDLEILECFRKIPKQDLREFIDWQIRYEKNMNTWLEACNCDLGKEDPTKHLIKIKEWLDEKEKEERVENDQK